MQKVGVEAVVEGLGAFIRDTGRMNSAIDGIRPQGTLLMRTFSGITEALGAFGREILNVAEFALGQLLASAIQFVIEKLSELISATIEAGAEFQVMELRLNRLNFNSLIESGDTYKEAMREATEITKDQLEWVQRLAIQTPYDAQDIANVFTLARSYGFAADEATQLTEDITNFAAGMGLGNVEIERIIVNFGQMVQQGKVTQRELNDLARGAFVPVNDIVRRMGENVSRLSNEDLTALSRSTGLTVTQLQHMADGTTEAEKSLTKFRSSTEGVNAFMQAFSDVVNERFVGSAENMARTFSGATANAQDLIKSLIGFGVVRPVLDMIGGRIADLVNSLTDDRNWDNLTRAAERVGTAITSVLGDLFSNMPSTDNLAEGIINGLNKIADWINTNRFKIKDFFEGIGETIQAKVVPFIKKIVDSFMVVRAWVDSNGPRIKEFFTALGTIIQKVFDQLTGGGGAGIQGQSPLEGFLEGVTRFMQYIIDNQDVIADWTAKLLKAFVVFQVIATILTVVGGIIVGVITFFLGLAAAIAGVVSVVTAIIAVLAVPFVAVVAIVVAAIGFVISMFVLLGAIILTNRDKIIEFATQAVFWFESFRIAAVSKLTEFIALATTIFQSFVAFATLKLAEFVTIVRAKFTEFLAAVSEKLTSFRLTITTAIEGVKAAFRDAPWGAIGRKIIEGVTAGVLHAAGALAAAAARVVTDAINAARAAAGIASPSKEGIYIGEMTMAGITKGIESGARNAVQAMESAVKMMAMPAMALPAITQQYAVAMPPGVSNSNTYTNNFNLTVNSGAPVEPILQDYNMMQSLIQR